MTPRSCIPVPKIEDDSYDWYERHRLKVRSATEQKFDVIFIGDSLTHFWTDESSSSHGGSVWHKYYDGRNVLNIGFGFDRTQNVLWRLSHGELNGQNPKLIVLNIGTNQFTITPKYNGDSPEDAAEGVKTVIDRLRVMFPETRIIVMAVFPRGSATEFFRTRIAELNRIVEDYVSGKPGIEFLDIGTQFVHDDGELKKELYNGDTHLTPAGYEVWAQALEPYFKSLEL